MQIVLPCHWALGEGLDTWWKSIDITITVMLESGKGKVWQSALERRHAAGISTSPELIPSMTSWGGWPSTVQPTLWQVPKISFTHPDNSFANDFDFIVRAISIISLRGMFPVCLMFFSFFRSRGGSVRRRISKLRVKKFVSFTFESLDNKRGCRRHNGNLCLSILDGELNGHP